MITLDYDSSHRPPRPNLANAKYRFFIGMLAATGLSAILHEPFGGGVGTVCCGSGYAAFGFGLFCMGCAVREAVVRNPPLEERNFWLTFAGGAANVAVWICLAIDWNGRYPHGTLFYIFGFFGTPTVFAWLVFKRSTL